ncbi:heterocyst development glycosyltransferase HepC [Cronbergia sp. UHCC 0137]|uniref:heterocyst development glycosyltransferase HepC n=1 Tax=Cronbergia sp. UHCC 0137 TaxID=3110239 RepID=UPI002B1FB6C0|nr:heterocyst development glycosyltransferase HepC [Cronbergia sp. UHCC 0137]MEA5616715.1 heterocyst development glycosyltransferase HepC [Cronbergia sp. UHCC 0137]
MTASIISSVENNYTVSQQYQTSPSQYCVLHWRMGQLLVMSPGKLNPPYLPALDNELLLIECLKSSPVNLVKIDSQLGAVWLKFWAEACYKANKPLFISSEFRNKLPKKKHQILRITKRLIDFCLALVLLVFLSPLILILMVLIQGYSPGECFSYQWCIGERGEVFRAISFSTISQGNITFMGLLMQKFGLDHLPKLLNVLKGEMSLISYRYSGLQDIVKVTS